SLRRIFSQHDHLIYAAGHEHNLQYFKEQTPSGLLQHHIISGSGSRPTPVGRGRGAVFTYGEAGFSVLKYYKDGSVWMEMWAPEAEGTKGRLLFRTELKTPARELVNPEIVSPVEPVDYTDSTVVMAVNPAYEAGALKRFFLGSHHREAWATPVEVPVLDLGREAGGLRPEKRGGGQQTTSLRLQGGDGQEYVLRSIDKDPSRTVPQNLQGTIATDIVQDQIASIHPFGAFIIPRLAAAAGVYHTNPRPVYVPHDPRLGLYQDFFSGHVVMLEERPDDDMSHAPRFGRSKQIISPHKLYREINDDNDHRVDLRAYARARLFDMLLSDWDRHVDQWRWASFEPHELDPTLEGEARTEGKVYRPIPRDRDFAFNRMNGLFPPIISIFDPKFQDFTESYGLLKGLNWNALRQDQRFTSGLERSDWIEIADSLRAALTDEVIEAAVREWPEPIYALDGEKTARLLRIRRDKLPDIAARFYALQARVVDVVGSNKHERFEVTRLNKDSTLVVVYKTSKSGRIRRMLYRRMFLEEETKEIRLYGLDGDDRFIVEGEVQDGIVIRAVGGAGHDRFVDRSQVLGASKHTRFYDTETGNEWDVGEETTTVRSDDDPAINVYNPADYKYNRSLPLTFFGSNKDDGFFIGGGISLIRHGFRKTPYAASHRIRANFAAKTQAFNIVYQGQFMSLIGHWDLTLDAAYLSPDNIRNFYGLGNETKNEERSRRFYQARLTQINLIPMLQKRIGLSSSFRFGPTFEVTKVGDNEDRFINQPQAGVSANTSDQWFVGANAALTLDTVDKTESLVNPMIGFKWTSTAAIHIGIENATETFSTLSTDLAVYLSPSLFPQVTVAARIGAAHNIGDFPFFSANTLGGISNLRGYRSTRFAGRSSVYQNVDLRLELFGFSSYLARGRFGVLGFFDHGRVWTDGERSKVWHQGYGGGVWIDMFNMFVLTGTAGFSEDDRTFTMKLGFQY
ncbi:MAG: BamA/TamA family outer membrane protein, partial [Rhodothermales bacterium]